MKRVRLMTWCPRSVSGMHLAVFAASEGGLFAERGLHVEYLASSAAPEAVGAGRADVALTSAFHVMAAQTKAGGALPVRFLATFHQRNPIVGVVREDSGRRTPADLAGARAARWSSPWFAREYAGALDYLGLAAPVLVDTPGGLDAALGSRDVDVLPMWMDDTTPARAQEMTLHHAGEGFRVRAIPLDIPVYSTGLVAADRLSPEVVRGMRDAIAAGHELQRAQPEVGLTGFRRRFPDVSKEHAVGNWALYEPYAFNGEPPGTMRAERWRTTIGHVARTHGLSTLRADRVFRPELLTAEGGEMRAEGLEPHGLRHQDLNLTCLPVPPRRRIAHDA